MTTTALRTKLYEIIRNADDKELHAIYNQFAPKTKEQTEWWKDDHLLADFDERSRALASGEDKGATINELTDLIEKLRQRRDGK